MICRTCPLCKYVIIILFFIGLHCSQRMSIDLNIIGSLRRVCNYSILKRKSWTCKYVYIYIFYKLLWKTLSQKSLKNTGENYTSDSYDSWLWWLLTLAFFSWKLTYIVKKKKKNTLSLTHSEEEQGCLNTTKSQSLTRMAATPRTRGSPLEHVRVKDCPMEEKDACDEWNSALKEKLNDLKAKWDNCKEENKRKDEWS